MRQLFDKISCLKKVLCHKIITNFSFKNIFKDEILTKYFNSIELICDKSMKKYRVLENIICNNFLTKLLIKSILVQNYNQHYSSKKIVKDEILAQYFVSIKLTCDKSTTKYIILKSII